MKRRKTGPMKILASRLWPHRYTSPTEEPGWCRKILVFTSMVVAFSLFPKTSFAVVDPLSGSFYIDQVDLILTFQSIQVDIYRSYTSVAFNDTRHKAGQWSFHPFHKQILFALDGRQLFLQDGESLTTFEKSGAEETFVSTSKERISLTNKEFLRFLKDGSQEVYDSGGKLTRIFYADGKCLTLSYNSGRLERILLNDRELMEYLYNGEGLIEQIKAYNGTSSYYRYNDKGLLISALNEDNIITRYAYDDQNRLIHMRFQSGDLLKIAYYEDTGIVKSVTKKDGVTTYAYEKDERGLISKVTVTSPTGVEALVIEDDGKVIKHTDPMGNLAESHYDENGLLLRRVDARGHAVECEYDSLHRLVEITRRDGNKERLSYLDGTSLVKEHVLADGSTIKLVYNDKRQVVKIIRPRGLEVSYQYNDMGLVDLECYGKGKNRFCKKYKYDDSGFLLEEQHYVEAGIPPLIAKSRVGGEEEPLPPLIAKSKGEHEEDVGPGLEESDSLTRTIGYKMDSRGRIIEILGPLDREWRYKYDDYGLLTEISDATQVVTSRKYDENLRLVQLRDRRGLTTYFSYDDKGNLQSVASARGSGETYEYDRHGRLKTVSDARGNRWSYEYDKLGFMTKELGPNEKTTTYRYDSSGNLIEREGPVGDLIRLQYDEMDRLISVMPPGGIKLNYTYDEAGRLIAEKDAAGNVKEYHYDSSANLVRVVLPDGGETLYEFDSQGFGNVVSVQASDGREYHYEYDPAGRLVGERAPWGETTRYSYDKAGNLVKKASSKGNSISYQYDRSNRITQVETSEGYTQRFEYDGKGNLIKILGKDFEKNVSYNDSGEVVSEEYPLLGTNVTYRYDEWGNRTSLEIPGHLRINYRYDSLGRLTSVEYNGKMIRISYDNLDRKTELSYPNGLKAKYCYNEMNLVDRIGYYESGGKAVDEYQYRYNKVGKLSRIADLKGRTRIFAYDANGQLVEVSSNGETTIFKYGPAFKRLAQITERQTRNFRHNRSGQLVETGDVRIGYDAPGNISRKITSNTETSYHFDSLGRLTRIQTPSTSVRYSYSPRGQRIGKEIGGEKSYYIYDGLNLLLELDYQKKPVRTFVHGEELDSPLVMLEARDSYYYLRDHLGSVIALVDEEGKITTRYEYDPFGQLTSRGTETGNPLTYTGRFYDRESGLYYYRARYYDPELGIFCSPDPYPKSIEHPQDFNGYVYVLNDPVNLVDPLGLKGGYRISWALRQAHIPEAMENLDAIANYGPEVPPRQTYPFWTKPHIIPGENVNSSAFWDRMAQDYAFLHDNVGPKTAERFRHQLNNQLYKGVYGHSPPKGMGTVGVTRPGGAGPRPGRVTVQGARPSGSGPSAASRAGPSAPIGSSSRLLSQIRRVGWGKTLGAGVFTAAISGWAGYCTGDRYRNQALAEGRVPDASDFLKALLETEARLLLGIYTYGISELIISTTLYTYHRGQLMKSLDIDELAERRLSQMKSEAARRVGGFTGVAASLVNEAKAIKTEQDKAIEEARSLAIKLQEEANATSMILSKIESEVLPDTRKLCTGCLENIKTLLDLSEQVKGHGEAVGKKREAAKDMAALVCKDLRAAETSARVDKAIEAAESARNEHREMRQKAERAQKLEREIKACITKTEENRDTISDLLLKWSEVAVKEKELEQYVEKAWKAAILAKTLPGQCALLRGRLERIYDMTKAGSRPGSTVPGKDAIAGYLREIRSICKEVSSKANNGESYAGVAKGTLGSLKDRSEKHRAQFEDVFGCALHLGLNVESPEKGLAQDLETISKEADKVARDAGKHADEAKQCYVSKLREELIEVEKIVADAKKRLSEASSQMQAIDAKIKGGKLKKSDLELFNRLYQDAKAAAEEAKRTKEEGEKRIEEIKRELGRSEK